MRLRLFTWMLLSLPVSPSLISTQEVKGEEQHMQEEGWTQSQLVFFYVCLFWTFHTLLIWSAYLTKLPAYMVSKQLKFKQVMRQCHVLSTLHFWRSVHTGKERINILCWSYTDRSTASLQRWDLGWIVVQERKPVD